MNDYIVTPDQRIKLKQINPGDTSHCKGGKKKGKLLLQHHTEQLVDLQEQLYAEGKHKILIVLQGMDTAGKDGTIRHVFDGVNPQGVRVACFKQPTPIESKHDFLWRIHPKAPGSGEIVIFNRSHYEDVLVVRVHDLVPKKMWSKRYEHINHFEKMLSDEGTTILKFFLHISKEEQKERLLARLNTPNKQWKLSESDAKERALWADYTKAYEEVLRKTSTSYAPWYVIPSDHKWYRNYLVGDIIIRTMKRLKFQQPEPTVNVETYTID